MTSPKRAQWNSRTGFILAAAGSAVGLGNVWKFPYITGENGGGAFVLVYLVCIVGVGVPVLMAEVLVGRGSRSSCVGAFRKLAGGSSPWLGVGGLAVFTSFALMSYYSTVAGWSLHYTYLSLKNLFADVDFAQAVQHFDELRGTPALGIAWQVLFTALTVLVVVAGVQKGIERWARIMMPGLLLLLLVLMIRALTMPGAGQALDFLFGMNWDKLTAAGVLEALGHSFFTLSLGMGAMITYGSYLRPRDDIASASLATAGADTLVAIMASMMLFPIVFSFGMEPGAGPGLLFVTLPQAIAQMAAGPLLSLAFFVMLVFAALTSAISMVEVIASQLIESFGMARHKAALLCGVTIIAVGAFATASGTWFDAVDYLVSNWCLPLGGLGIALFTAWRVDEALRSREFRSGSALARFYGTWLWTLKYPVPACILLVFLHAVGVV